MPESEEVETDQWADGVDYRLLVLERQGKTLKIGVVVGIGAGAAGIAMSMILGRTVTKLAQGMGQLGEITNAMFVQMNPSMAQTGPQPGERIVTATGAPGPDVPSPSSDGAARSFLAPRGTLPDESIRTGDDTSEAVDGPESGVPDWAREAMATELLDAKGTAPDAGTAVTLDDDDIPPVGA